MQTGNVIDTGFGPAPESETLKKMKFIHNDLQRIEREISALQARARELRTEALEATGISADQIVHVTRGEVVYARRVHFDFDYTLDDPCFVIPMVRIEGSPLKDDGTPNERQRSLKRSVSFPKWRFPL